MEIGIRLGIASGDDRPQLGPGPIIPEFVSFIPRSSLSGTSITITNSPAVTNGNVLIACIAVAATEAVTPPAGWTLIAETLYSSSTQHFLTYYKVAASEGASWVWSWTLNRAYNGFVAEYRGVDTVSPILGSTSNPNQASSVNSVATGLTPGEISSTLLGIYGCGVDRTYTSPADMTERGEVGTGPSTTLCDLRNAGSGASGNKTAVLSSASGNGAQLIALRSAD